MPNWFNTSDWTAARSGGAVRFKVIFNPDGLPDTCSIQASTGNKDVEAMACATVKKRFRYEPSFDSDGAPVSRVLERSVAIDGSLPESLRAPALFSFTVKGHKDVSALSVIVDVKKDGSLAGCAVDDDKESRRSVATAVCQGLPALWTPLPEVDRTGTPIRYLRPIAIEIKHAP